MSKDNGGAAFPYVGQKYKEHGDGMTLRDYFAAKAMQGILADPEAMHEGDDDTFGIFADCISSQAYEIADAMLGARK